MRKINYVIIIIMIIIVVDQSTPNQTNMQVEVWNYFDALR